MIWTTIGFFDVAIVIALLQWSLLWRHRILDLEIECCRLERLAVAHMIEALEKQNMLLQKTPRSMRYAFVAIPDHTDGVEFALKTIGIELPVEFCATFDRAEGRKKGTPS